MSINTTTTLESSVFYTYIFGFGRDSQHTAASLQIMSTRHSGSNNARALEWEVTHPNGCVEKVIALGHWAKTTHLNKSMLYRAAKLGVSYKDYKVRKLS
jgi:hypothetical protein